jgi:hypothetical protein
MAEQKPTPMPTIVFDTDFKSVSEAVDALSRMQREQRNWCGPAGMFISHAYIYLRKTYLDPAELEIVAQGKGN